MSLQRLVPCVRVDIGHKFGVAEKRTEDVAAELWSCDQFDHGIPIKNSIVLIISISISRFMSLANINKWPQR